MAKNIAFKAYTEGASWADDDDELDAQPFIIAPPKVPEVAEKEQPEEEAPARRDDSHDKHAGNGGRGARQERSYDDRRGGHERNYDDRRGGHSADRRGGGGYRDDHHHDRESHRSQHGGRDGGDYAERPKNPLPDRPPYKLYIGNLPFQMRAVDLEDFLGDADSISDIHIPMDRDTDRPKGFAYVEFKTREALVKALELDGVNAGGRAVKIDVASERRQERSGGFFDRRESRPMRGHDREERGPPAARERPHFALLPRTNASAEAGDAAAKKASIFGDAKPRDESAYLERQKAKELERKKEKEAARKKEQERKKEKEAARKKSVDETKPKDDGETKQGPPSRKNSHDDGHGFRAGAGRGSTRGGRGDRSGRVDGRGRGGEHGGRADGRGRGGEHGGRGRGGEHGGRGHAGRGAREGSAGAKKESEPTTTAAAAAAPASARKSSEPRVKRAEPVKVKPAAPAPVKSVNAFSALDLDSDSD